MKKNERGLRFRNREFERVLHAGTHRLFSPIDTLRVEVFALEQAAFTHALADYLMPNKPEVVAVEFVHVELDEHQVGLRTENGVLQVRVPDHGAGIMRIDGTVDRLLAPGAYAFWKFNRNVSVEPVDLQLQALEVTGPEILTLDKVALRLNLSATWRLTDVPKAYQELAKPADHLQLVGVGVGVKDIVLPGEMKTIIARVVEAGKAAEANVIRRREVTAATRSLLNTAKVMEGNLVAPRMKELETPERVAIRIDKISVFGRLDQALDGRVKLQR